MRDKGVGGVKREPESDKHVRGGCSQGAYAMVRVPLHASALMESLCRPTQSALGGTVLGRHRATRFDGRPDWFMPT